MRLTEKVSAFLLFLISTVTVCTGIEKESAASVCGSAKFKVSVFPVEGTYDLSGSSRQKSRLILKGNGTAESIMIFQNSECTAETVTSGTYIVDKELIVINFTYVSPGKKNTCKVFSNSGQTEDIFRLKSGLCEESKVLTGHFSGLFFVKKELSP